MEIDKMSNNGGLKKLWYVYTRTLCTHLWIQRCYKLPLKVGQAGDCPGGAVVKTPCSQCREPGLDPWSGN